MSSREIRTNDERLSKAVVKPETADTTRQHAFDGQLPKATLAPISPTPVNGGQTAKPVIPPVTTNKKR